MKRLKRKLRNMVFISLSTQVNITHNYHYKHNNLQLTSNSLLWFSSQQYEMSYNDFIRFTQKRSSSDHQPILLPFTSDHYTTKVSFITISIVL